MQVENVSHNRHAYNLSAIAEKNLKKENAFQKRVQKSPERYTFRAKGQNKTPRSRVDPVITCTFTDRWVACGSLYRFQHPAADGSREACEPRTKPASLITKCGLKKDPSRTPQGIQLIYYLIISTFASKMQEEKCYSSSSSANSSSMNSS